MKGLWKDKKIRLLFFAACFVLGLILVLWSGNGKKEEPETAPVFAVSDAEEEITALLASLNGISDVRVAVTLGEDGRTVSGIAVVCVGGDDPVNQKKILSLLCALYGLPSTRIGISS